MGAFSCHWPGVLSLLKSEGEHITKENGYVTSDPQMIEEDFYAGMGHADQGQHPLPGGAQQHSGQRAVSGG